MGKKVAVIVDTLARFGLLEDDLDYHLLRAAMVVIFAWLGWDKWHVDEIQQLVPLITHGPLIFWTIPVLGIRGTSILLGTSEWRSRPAHSNEPLCKAREVARDGGSGAAGHLAPERRRAGAAIWPRSLGPNPSRVHDPASFH